jgi:hypothetical protein
VLVAGERLWAVFSPQSAVDLARKQLSRASTVANALNLIGPSDNVEAGGSRKRKLKTVDDTKQNMARSVCCHR